MIAPSQSGRNSSDAIATLMTSFRQGNKAAATQLFELFYPELRRLAAARMRNERTEHTWEPTVLANELYLELIKIKALRPAEDGEDERAAFFGLAAHLMRRLLIHHSRRMEQRTEKIPISDREELCSTPAESLGEIEMTLARLASIKPVLRTVVEMKVFEGMTADEIAGQIGCAPVTVSRYWSFARNWLQDHLSAGKEA